MAVPWSGYKVEYETHREEIEAAIRRVLESGEYQRSGEVEAFEEEFAHFCGARYAIGTGSCYGAMLLGLLACGVGAGDEVITVSNTDIACTAAISQSHNSCDWVRP